MADKEGRGLCVGDNGARDVIDTLRGEEGDRKQRDREGKESKSFFLKIIIFFTVENNEY